MKTFWLSFCDDSRPVGEQFLGACVIDVTDDDAENSHTLIQQVFPDAMEDSNWIAEAIRKAHVEGCNPGGQVASADISDAPPDMLALYPRNRLMSKVELEAIAPVASMDTLEAFS